MTTDRALCRTLIHDLGDLWFSTDPADRAEAKTICHRCPLLRSCAQAGPGHPHTRAPGRYLCRPCWHQLPPGARTALNRRGDGAIQRLQTLYDQLVRGIPLTDIRITDE